MHRSLPHILGALLSIIVLGGIKAQYTDVINSNRPSKSMGAFSLGKNVYQWEQGLSLSKGDFSSFQNASFSVLSSQIQLRVGLLKEQLEVVGVVDYQTVSYTHLTLPTKA